MRCLMLASLLQTHSNLYKRHHSKITQLNFVELQDFKPLAYSDLKIIITWYWDRPKRIIRNNNNQSMKKIKASRFGPMSILVVTMVLLMAKIRLKSYISTI